MTVETVRHLARKLAQREFGDQYEGYESSHRALAEFCVAVCAPAIQANALRAAADDMECVGPEEFDTVNYPIEDPVDWLRSRASSIDALAAPEPQAEVTR